MSNCTANDNGSAGISAYYSLISNCTTYSNTGDGIAVEACVVKGCNVRENSGYGIRDESETSYSYAYRNAVQGNTLGQIEGVAVHKENAVW